MNKAYKYEIQPTIEQQVLLQKTFGCCRKVWNLMLADKITYYKIHKTMLQTTPATYKTQYPFLREVDSLALANVQLNLQRAYKRFFEDKSVGFPKFKSKHHSKKSYTTNNQKGTIQVLSDAIKLPKLGIVKAKIHRTPPADYKLKSATVSQERDGTYYVSVLYEYKTDIQPVETIQTHVGLDYKSDGLFVASDGNVANMPHFYRKSEKRLAKEQRKLSRKQKRSSNYEKQRIKIAKLSRHVANQRRDFLQKLSTEITNRYDLISVEDLNMKNMSQSLHLGKATMDNGYGMFLNMVAYKQETKGHYFIKVNRLFPSSQLCQCGYKNPITKDLKMRTITCPVCNRTYDRDENAAINIDKEGYRLLLQSM